MARVISAGVNVCNSVVIFRANMATANLPVWARDWVQTKGDEVRVEFGDLPEKEISDVILTAPITKLRFSLCDISHLPTLTLPPTLQHMTIYACSHVALPACLPNAQHTLALFEAKSIDCLPTAIPHLKELTIDGCSITDIPPELMNDAGMLEKLSVCSNYIRVIPSSICNAHALVEMDLCNNQLESIPPEIGNLTNLRILILTTNKLRELPESFGALKALEQLWLGGNDITQLPKSVGGMSSLQELYMPHNKLSALPVTFGSLRALKYVDLSTNEFEDGPPVELGGLHNLETLILDYNPLGTTGALLYWDMPRLQYIKMSCTQITTLSFPCNMRMPALKKLFVRDNPDLRCSLHEIEAKLPTQATLYAGGTKI